MQDEKYVVFKREEFEEGIKAYQRGEGPIQIKAVRDAVVIRTQDAFAASGLSAYYHLVQFYIDMNPMLMSDDPIYKVANYLKAVTEEAEDRLSLGQCKLPD